MPPIAALLLLAGFVPDAGDALAAAAPLATAALGGLAVGIERQWSGHAPAHLPACEPYPAGGLRGARGMVVGARRRVPAVVLLAAAAALILIAYVAASRRDVEGTSEVAALVVLAAGFLSGTGALAIASGVIAVTLLMLVEKTRLHAWVRGLNDEELRAGARFAVMAVVILPLLPEGPYGPLGGVRPRLLWTLVLLFSGLSFAGYIARRLVGPQRGTVMAGLLGGLVSSTQVTLAHARASHDQPSLGLPLASGALAASTVLFVRTTLAAAILAPALARALLPSVVLPAVVGHRDRTGAAPGRRQADSVPARESTAAARRAADGAALPGRTDAGRPGARYVRRDGAAGVWCVARPDRRRRGHGVDDADDRRRHRRRRGRGGAGGGHAVQHRPQAGAGGRRGPWPVPHRHGRRPGGAGGSDRRQPAAAPLVRRLAYAFGRIRSERSP